MIYIVQYFSIVTLDLGIGLELVVLVFIRDIKGTQKFQDSKIGSQSWEYNFPNVLMDIGFRLGLH